MNFECRRDLVDNAGALRLSPVSRGIGRHPRRTYRDSSGFSVPAAVRGVSGWFLVNAPQRPSSRPSAMTCCFFSSLRFIHRWRSKPSVQSMFRFSFSLAAFRVHLWPLSGVPKASDVCREDRLAGEIAVVSLICSNPKRNRFANVGQRRARCDRPRSCPFFIATSWTIRVPWKSQEWNVNDPKYADEFDDVPRRVNRKTGDIPTPVIKEGRQAWLIRGILDHKEYAERIMKISNYMTVDPKKYARLAKRNPLRQLSDKLQRCFIIVDFITH